MERLPAIIVLPIVRFGLFSGIVYSLFMRESVTPEEWIGVGLCGLVAAGLARDEAMRSKKQPSKPNKYLGILLAGLAMLASAGFAPVHAIAFKCVNLPKFEFIAVTNLVALILVLFDIIKTRKKSKTNSARKKVLIYGMIAGLLGVAGLSFYITAGENRTESMAVLTSLYGNYFIVTILICFVWFKIARKRSPTPEKQTKEPLTAFRVVAILLIGAAVVLVKTGESTKEKNPAPCPSWITVPTKHAAPTPSDISLCLPEQKASDE